ncbi:hypothetical protein KIL84_011754 [Mauremys mutica]|uniref:Uncharacterized protein n=1 Tax=Mauremys mutica TaxID=74926 RepID=A0A9D3XEA4_9SAUR|nr:hypothetical protein KIL84_011754 [Mauremys mutica]
MCATKEVSTSALHRFVYKEPTRVAIGVVIIMEILGATTPINSYRVAATISPAYALECTVFPQPALRSNSHTLIPKYLQLLVEPMVWGIRHPVSSTEVGRQP